ncbi:MAG: sugar isomerase [Candidatus Melainabacteria bacterium RIFCSPLOWO2_02_FULL_35_15]|nr:MAG: sugar isomerase [Candidatus Melainabacteria bacterium RIFCSPLOWO2_12_FULL_35_11]OGI13664.1 MAG: sugar isomerase [Candidatus Melainabacteria bacterium RIFCSPLOWO2_02_FULL_35_15]
MNYIKTYLEQTSKIAQMLDQEQIHLAINILLNVRNEKGRLFILGVGGSAGNASHAVNDFRKIAGIEAYAPTDNVSELTARVNDDGWDSVFSSWLKVSNLNSKDVLIIFSVGGGSIEKNISTNLVKALNHAKSAGAKTIGIVSRNGGYTKEVADCCILIPTLSPETVTPHAEEFQAVVWHLLVSHPEIQKNQMKWESTVQTVSINK